MRYNSSSILLALVFIALLPLITYCDTRCGTSWSNADSTCQKTCTTDNDCKTIPNTLCYADVRACSTPTTQTIPSGDCSKKRTLTLNDLQSFMGRPGGTDLSGWLTATNAVLSRYGLDCPARIAAFMAQVRHETAGMTIFYQPIDNGAGSHHMTPSNWQYACNAVPEIKAKFAAVIPGCTECSCTADMATNPMEEQATIAAKQVFSDPMVAMLSGGWWWVEGAKISSIFGWKGCGDLRLNADQGLGGAGSGDCYHSGLYQITCCIFWTIGSSSGLHQRIDYYNQAKTIALSWGLGFTNEDTVASASSSLLSIGAVCGIAVGAIVGVIGIVAIIVVIIIKKRRVNELA